MFQIKLNASRWKRVDIREAARALISAKEFTNCPNVKIRTLKGKKVSVAANFLEVGQTYAFKASKACTVQFIPASCQSQPPSVEKSAKVSDELLENPDPENQ